MNESLRLQRLRERAVNRPFRSNKFSSTGGYLPRGRYSTSYNQQITSDGEAQKEYDDFVQKINSTNDINTIKNLVNSTSPLIKNYANEILNKIITEQNNTISSLEVDYKKYLENENKYQKKSKDTKYSDSRRDEYKAMKEKYEDINRELGKIINEMKAGKLYNYSSVKSYISDVGKSAYSETKYSLDKKRALTEAQKSAQSQTLSNIKKSGYTPVYNMSGNLIGYQTGKSEGFIEYRFDNKGNSVLYSSDRFKPIISNNSITGYTDVITKQSVASKDLQSHIKNENYKEYLKLQKQLGQGEKLIADKNYNIVGIQSSKLGKTIMLDDKGIAEYNKIISSNKKFNFKEYIKELKQQELMSGQSVIPEKWYTPSGARESIEKRVRVLDKKISRNIALIQTSTVRGDYKELIQLTKKYDNKTITQQENKRRIELQKIEVEKRKAFAEIIFGTVYGTMIKVGFGTFDFLNSLRKDPINTIKILPPLIKVAVINDLNNILSGDPFKIGTTFTEYWASGVVLGVMGRATKSTFKNSVKLGSYLTPKYFKNIAKELKITGAVSGRITKGALKDLEKALTVAVKDSRLSKELKNYYKYSVKRASNIKAGAKRLYKSTDFSKKLTVAKTNVLAKKELSARIKRAREYKKVKIKQKKLDIKKKKDDYNKSLLLARKIRRKSSKEWTIFWSQPQIKSYLVLEELKKVYLNKAKIDALNFLIQKKKLGLTLTKYQREIFINKIQEYYIKRLTSSTYFKYLENLGKLNKTFYIKIPKPYNLAKKYFKLLIKNIEKSKYIKYINDLFKRIKSGIKKKQKKLSIKKQKDDYNKSLLLARKIRRKSKKTELLRDKGIKLTKRQGGDDFYVRALNFVNDFADALALRVSIIEYRELLKRGFRPINKLAEKKAKEILVKINKRRVREYLLKFNEYKSLIKKAKATDPNKKIFRTKKEVAKELKILKKLNKKIEKEQKNIFVKNIKKLNEKLEKFEKKRIKISKTKERKTNYLKSNRYILDKKNARNIKILTPSQIRRANARALINSGIDKIFRDLSIRRKLGVPEVKISQLKNIIKRKLKRAYDRKDAETVSKIKNMLEKLSSDVYSESKLKAPDIRVIELKPVARKTTSEIKNFKPQSPSGTFQEIKSGSTILLQKMESPKTLTIQKKAPLKLKTVKKLKIVSINKKLFNIKTLVKLLSSIMVRSMLKYTNANKLKSISLSKFTSLPLTINLLSPLEKQDFIVLTSFIPASLIINDIKTELKYRYKFPTPTITKRIKTDITPKKKKGIIKSYPTKKRIIKRTTGINAYYVITKRRGKMVKLNPSPLRINDARDFLAYSVDNNLTKSAWLVPVGIVKQVVIPPKKIQGYYSKVSSKLRPYKIKYGRKKQLINGYIEKRKYFVDTKGERTQIGKLIRKSKSKKKVIRRIRKKK